MYTIYMHNNKLNNKKYVGMTKRKVEKRWQYNGKGYSGQTKFFNAILKYGWDNFDHIVLEQCETEEEALEREAFYISKFDAINNGYNVCPRGTEENSVKKPVYCLTTKTLYKSITEAAEKNNISSPFLIIQNCKGDNGGVKGLQWTYWDEYNKCPVEKEKTFVRYKNLRIPVYAIELNENFDCAKDAAKKLNLDHGAIRACINGHRNSIKGLHFINSEDKNNLKLIFKRLTESTDRNKPIICLDTKEIFLQIKQAEKFVNRNSTTILNNCQGKTKRCGGYKFQYLYEYIIAHPSQETLTLIQKEYQKKWFNTYGEE